MGAQVPKVVHVLPLLYLHGVSSGDFVPSLEQFFGSGSGLSASAITRLTTARQADRDQFMARKLKNRDYVYIWVDWVHFKVRLGNDGRLCCLVMVGVRLDSSKELIAITVAYRASTESWASCCGAARSAACAPRCSRSAMAPLGFWAAVRDVFPETRPQRDWVHKIANVLDCLPKSVQSGRQARAARDRPR